MTDARCEAFLQDPEQFAGHPDACAACRKLVSELDRIDRGLASERIAGDPVVPATDVESLPLAPWEGARFRSWPVAVASASAILFAAVMVFMILGVSPIAGVLDALFGPLARSIGYVEATRHVAGVLKAAPFVFHAAVAFAFVAVNAAFFYVLRRAPKGIDVSSR